MTRKQDETGRRQEPDQHSDESNRRFWRALKPDMPARPPVKKAAPANAVDLTSDISDLGPEERESRRRALLSMLDANQARQQGSARTQPVLAAGHRVRVRGGEFKGCIGVIADADYIQSRVLLALETDQAEVWIDFVHLAAPAAE